MPDKISKEEQRLITEYIKSGKQVQRIATGKMAIDVTKPLDYRNSNSTGFARMQAQGMRIRKKISRLLSEGKTLEEIEKEMHMSRANVHYHIRKINASKL
jgi:DNA-binding CsgD family transcriptional regulator